MENSANNRNAYALLVGVGSYLDERISNLPATINDVNLLANSLKEGNFTVSVDDNIRILTGKDASMTSILMGIDWLIECASKNANSTVLFYFSGHGLKNEKRTSNSYFLIPHDCDCSNVGNTAISDDTLSRKFNSIQSSRFVAIIDACHAGGVTKDENYLPNNFIKASFSPSEFFSKYNSVNGRVIISSSKENESSYIKSPDFKVSIFTFHILEAFSETGFTNRNFFGVIDLFSYLSSKVPETASLQIDSRTGKPSQQHPVMDSVKTENFPIVFRGDKSLPKRKEINPINKRLILRKEELIAPLMNYLEQRKALEEDISLSSLDFQRVAILKKRLEKLNSEINKLEEEISGIERNLELPD